MLSNFETMSLIESILKDNSLGIRRGDLAKIPDMSHTVSSNEIDRDENFVVTLLITHYSTDFLTRNVKYSLETRLRIRSS